MNMRDFDVFNGDADGLISLLQLRLSEPREAELVTGRKRDIALLERVDAGKGDRVTVLDVSMRTNAEPLRRILKAGAQVTYFDHHNPGDIPDVPNLNATINIAGEVCTAVLVDRFLGGAHRAWAVTACYGDNFPDLAERLSHGYALPLSMLRELGEMLNYNGYGAGVEDLHYHPRELYHEIEGYHTPMAFLSDKPYVLEKLSDGYFEDFQAADSSDLVLDTPQAQVRILANSARSRRISGMYGNQLAQDFPRRAHAILTEQAGGYLVSIRAPQATKSGADTLALQFETGGGRAAAAGINHLPETDLERFIKAFQAAF